MADFRDGFGRVIEIVARLRAPGGCPWDREQTHRSLTPYVIEEAYEVVDAIERGTPDDLRDELGDLALQVVLHAQIAGERGAFTIDDVLQACADKLIRRHPHVLAPDQPSGAASDLSSQDGSVRWEAAKRRDRVRPDPSIVEGLPVALPALARAHKVQVRAAGVGFDWPRREDILAKVDEELAELRHALDREPRRVEDELGDLLFTLVNLARRFGVDAEGALRRATARFAARLAHMEQSAAGQSLAGMAPAELERLWTAAKAVERAERSTGE